MKVFRNARTCVAVWSALGQFWIGCLVMSAAEILEREFGLSETQAVEVARHVYPSTPLHRSYP